ncbi:MAG: class I SAM-dependent methyltransferase [Kiritimatiellae bacterium]|nr:class I SAM-dependent methyltransferase [Kiritimatiellia bacterium]
MTKAFTFIKRYLLSLAGCLYLLTVGVLRRDHREILHEITFRLGLRKRPVPPPSGPTLLIPVTEAKALFSAPPLVSVLEQDVADGNVSGYELLVISQLIADLKPKACFEIGTFDGRTTLNMAANAGTDCHVYTLDLPQEEVDKTGLKIATGDEQFIKKESSGARFSGSPWAKNITQLYGDSATFDFSPYEGKMDVVFVDGAHSYDYVKSDTAVALRLLKPEGGLIMWHDYGSPYWKDLTRSLNDLYEGTPSFKSMRNVMGTVIVVWRK